MKLSLTGVTAVPEELTNRGRRWFGKNSDATAESVVFSVQNSQLPSRSISQITTADSAIVVTTPNQAHSGNAATPQSMQEGGSRV